MRLSRCQQHKLCYSDSDIRIWIRISQFTFILFVFELVFVSVSELVKSITWYRKGEGKHRTLGINLKINKPTNWTMTRRIINIWYSNPLLQWVEYAACCLLIYSGVPGHGLPCVRFPCFLYALATGGRNDHYE